MHRHTFTLCAMFITVAACAVSSGVAERKPAQGSAVEDVTRGLRQSNLELSDAQTSAAARFSLVLTVSAVRGKWLGTAFDALVERDGDRTAYLFRYANGLPYLFVGNGVAVWYDPAHPGKLRMLRDAHPTLSLRSADGGLDFRMGVTHEPASARVVFDIGSIVNAEDDGQTRRAYDALRDRLEIERERSLTTVRLHAPQAPYPVQGLRVVSSAGKVIELEDIAVGPAARQILLAVNADVLLASRLPVQPVNADAADTKGKFPQAGLPPAGDVELLAAFGRVFSNTLPRTQEGRR